MSEEKDFFHEKAETARQEAGKELRKNKDLIHNLAKGMVRNFKNPEYEPGQLAMEQMMKMRKNGNHVVQAQEETKNEEAPPFIVEGHKLPLSPSHISNAVILMMYIFATVLSKNKRIKKILDEANFNFADADGNQIYPKPKKRKKRKNKNVRTRKNNRSRKRRMR